jgi:hypothetical protein
MLFSGEDLTSFQNCTHVVVSGEAQIGNIGNDGLFFHKTLKVYNKFTNKWERGIVTSFNNKITTYTIELASNKRILEVKRFPNDHIRFV